jgi:hypothetical protein
VLGWKELLCKFFQAALHTSVSVYQTLGEQVARSAGFLLKFKTKKEFHYEIPFLKDCVALLPVQASPWGIPD